MADGHLLWPGVGLGELGGGGLWMLAGGHVPGRRNNMQLLWQQQGRAGRHRGWWEGCADGQPVGCQAFPHQNLPLGMNTEFDWPESVHEHMYDRAGHAELSSTFLLNEVSSDLFSGCRVTNHLEIQEHHRISIAQTLCYAVVLSGPENFLDCSGNIRGDTYRW